MYFRDVGMKDKTWSFRVTLIQVIGTCGSVYSWKGLTTRVELRGNAVQEVKSANAGWCVGHLGGLKALDPPEPGPPQTSLDALDPPLDNP